MHHPGADIKPGTNGHVPTVEGLACAKRLPLAFLRELGIENLSGGGVSIPYYDLDGTELYRRERDRPGGPRFRQPAGVRLRPYGLDRLDYARRVGHVYIAEGESDTWALLHHKLPALGLPGSNTAKVLEAEHLAGLDALYLLPDADEAGERMAEGVERRLADLRWGGRLFRVRLPDGVKDTSDWHARAPERFAEELEAAVACAEAVALEAPEAHRCSGPPGASVRRLPAYNPFPLKLLPPVLREYVGAAAAAIGCDPALVALPALATAAGAIGNSRALRLKRGWNEPAVLWTVTVAPSGAHKSPAFAAAVDPLMDLQMAEVDAAKRGEDDPPHYVTCDATIEAVGELLRDSPRGLLLARDELDGWFQSFTRHKGRGGGTDRPHWLELHRAATLFLDRVTRERGPLRVRRACASVTGTIQPRVLARCLDDEAMAAGLGARFLLAMPPARRRRWTEAEVDEHLAQRYSDLLRSLLGLQLADAAKRRPHFLNLSPPAKRLWVDWFGRWGDAISAAEGEQAAALSKLEGYAARLALVHHVVSLAAADAPDLGEVTEASLQAGTALAEWFAVEAGRIYATLKESAEEAAQRRLVEWIAGRGGKATVRDLQRANRRRWPTREAAEADLDELAAASLGEWVEAPAPPQGGHPPRWFQLHAAAPDTSDTRPEVEAPAEAQATDARADTPPPTFEFREETGRVSEVSGAAADPAEVGHPLAQGSGAEQVPERGSEGPAEREADCEGGWTAPGLGPDDLLTPW